MGIRRQRAWYLTLHHQAKACNEKEICVFYEKRRALHTLRARALPSIQCGTGKGYGALISKQHKNKDPALLYLDLWGTAAIWVRDGTRLQVRAQVQGDGFV